MESYYLTTTPMSKDKPGKNVKKAPNPVGKKPPSDYQSGKKSSSSNDVIFTKKTK